MTAGRRDGRDLVLEVRVQPRASRSEFAGLHGDRVRVRLQAPPVDGRANAALVEFLAAALDVPRARVTIEHGLSGRDKRVRIRDAGVVAPQMKALIGCD
ncbi:MAG: uncharacterized protein QG586_1705 [Pseudomonadota bacterium]|nr:uncharacterized protein [Pseudomonadota bacterium]